MTVLAHFYSGPDKGGRHYYVLETPAGMLLNEQYLIERIRGGEQASYNFILEIAESTLPFRNVADLLNNLINYTNWTLENANLRAICDQIISACEKAFMPNAVPATAGTCYPGRKIDYTIDDNGRGQKYYPHTYEAILHPHMVPALDKTFDEVAKRRETRARRYEIGFRRWDSARCAARRRLYEEYSKESQRADQGDGGAVVQGSPDH